MATQSTCTSMIAAVGRSEPHAWILFAQTYAPMVVARVRRRGVEARDLEDVCQEVFVAVHRSLGQFRVGERFRPWLMGIVDHKVADEQRRRRRQLDRCEADLSVTAGYRQAIAPEDSDPSAGTIDVRRVFLQEVESLRRSSTARSWTMFWQTAVE